MAPPISSILCSLLRRRDYICNPIPSLFQRRFSPIGGTHITWNKSLGLKLSVPFSLVCAVANGQRFILLRSSVTCVPLGRGYTFTDDSLPLPRFASSYHDPTGLISIKLTTLDNRTCAPHHFSGSPSELALR